MAGRLRLWAAAAALAAIAALGTTPHAQAAFSISVSEGTGGAQGTATLNDNGIVTNQTNGGSGSIISSSSNPSNSFVLGNANTKDFSVQFLSGSSNSPGSVTTGTITLSALTITNTGTGPATLTITATGDGFTSPSASYPIALTTQVSATGTLKGADMVTSVSTGTPVSLSGTAGSTTEAKLTSTASGNNGFGSFTTAGGGYSLTQTVTITLGKGESIQLSGHTDAIAPAPGSLTLASGGLLCFAPLLWLRRRKMALLAA